MKVEQDRNIHDERVKVMLFLAFFLALLYIPLSSQPLYLHFNV
jgi:hypothetical protein